MAITLGSREVSGVTTSREDPVTQCHQGSVRVNAVPPFWVQLCTPEQGLGATACGKMGSLKQKKGFHMLSSSTVPLLDGGTHLR